MSRPMRKLFASILLALITNFCISCTPAPVPDKDEDNTDPVPEKPVVPVEDPEPDDPEPEGPTVSFRLMSFNILQATSETAGHEWATVRKPACLKMFRDINPDIVCVQECRKSQCSDLETALPAYAQIKYPKDGIESNGGQRNLIMYKPALFKMLGWDKFWFSEDGTPSGGRWGDDATTQKMTIFAKFQHKSTGKVFWVYCTHFFAKCNLETSRPHCVEMSLDSIKKQAGADGTVFFCGDLNLEPANPVLKPMFDYMHHAATDAEQSDGVNTITYNGFRTTNLKVLDHIFYRNAKARTYKVVNSQTDYGTNWISDHYPIYSDIDF